LISFGLNPKGTIGGRPEKKDWETQNSSAGEKPKWKKQGVKGSEGFSAEPF